MIIDAHNHPDWNGHDFNRFLGNMQKCHIDKTWLLPRECPDNEVHFEFLKSYTPGVPGIGQLPFSRCLSYYERAPEKFVLGFSPDPRKPEALGQLEAAAAIYGIRICGEIKLRMMYDNIDAIRIYQACARLHLPVVLHLENPYIVNDKEYWFGGGMDAMERALRKCPETIFIAHGPGFWSYISGDDKQNELYPQGKVLSHGLLPEFLRRYPNLYGDMSANSCRNALCRDKIFAREFCLEFQDRLLYARDCFSNDLQELLETFELPAVAKEKIYCGNALQLVPL